MYECKLRGILKRKDNKHNCVVGDKVEFSEDNSITEIESRKNLLERPLVANIDYIVIQFAAKDPVLDLERLNTLVLSSFYYKIAPIVVVNKIDLLSSEELSKIKNDLNFLKKLEIPCLFISEKENIGIDQLKVFLQNKVTAFGGPSGVGKSSIINLLQNVKNLETGETSKRLKRGKHTTKDTNLLPLPDGGFIIDTPGFSSVELPYIKDVQELISLFPEFRTDKNCKFHNCLHLNEPDCIIKEMVSKEEIAPIRYNFYKKTFEKLKNERWNRYE